MYFFFSVCWRDIEQLLRVKSHVKACITSRAKRGLFLKKVFIIKAFLLSKNTKKLTYFRVILCGFCDQHVSIVSPRG